MTEHSVNRRPPSSLVSRLAASNAILAAVIIVLTVFFFIALHGDFFTSAIDTTLRGYGTSLAEPLWNAGDGLADMASQVAARHRVGIVLATGEPPEPRMAVDAGGSRVDAAELDGLMRYRRIEIHGADGRAFWFYFDMVEFAAAHLPLLLALIVLVSVAAAVTYAFQLAQVRPIRWLHRGVEAVAAGDFSVRVPEVRNDEVGQVARAFNTMTGKVESMVRDRERLLGDVSHELRSPLARIKVALALLPDGKERDGIDRDVRHMESLISTLLERQRLIAAGDGLTQVAPVDLVDLARQVAGDFAHRAPRVEVVAAEPLAVEGDRDLLAVLLHNLVDNGVKFSAGGQAEDAARVEIHVDEVDGDAELVVADRGPGVPVSEADRVFEPFVKLDPSRGHRTGHGLGLDLCRRIAAAHGGSIHIEPRDGGGTRVVVRVPGGRGANRPAA